MNHHVPAAAAQPKFRLLDEGSRCVVVAFVASRLLIVGVILLSRTIFVPGQFSQGGGLLSVLTHWDGGWYLQIAEQGYTFTPGEQSSIGFFPVYPLLIWLLSALFIDPPIAAVVISNACLLGAGLLLNALVRLEYRDGAISCAAVTLLMFSPVSFFFSSAYSESTFLLLSIGTFLAARRGNWLVACLCGGALAATRNVGVIIAVPLFVEYIRQVWKPGTGLKPLLTPRILLFGFIPLGLALFLLFNYIKFGDAFAYVKATAVWGRYFVPPWRTLANAQGLPPFYLWLFGGTLLAAVLAWIGGFYLRVRTSYMVWAGLLLAVYLCGNSLEAMPRYLSVLFPVFVVLGVVAVRFGWSYELIFACSTVLLTVCTILSANGYWMT
ncbi:MAG TPA: mannosyltransferase family protein [Chthoniobacterales bacterium]|nr:mannosyltransferase family protein [Chthoniobacterales bacterium]